MSSEDLIIIFSIIACCGIVISMVVKMNLPKKTTEEYAEVIKKNQFKEQNYKYNTVRTRYSISFLINGKKKSFYCNDGFFNYVKSGDKVRIVHDRDNIIDLERV